MATKMKVTKKRVLVGSLIAIALIIVILAGLILIPPVFSSETTYSRDTTLSILSGDVKVLKAGADEWKKAENGMKLAADDSVRTGPDSYALITFFEGSTLTLEPDTEVLIREIWKSEESDATAVRLRQKVGQTWNRIQKLTDSASAYEIETPAGVGSVRGTTIGMEVEPDGETTMGVFEGQGRFQGEGIAIELPAGTESTAQPGEPPAPTQTIPPPASVLRFSVNSSAWMKVVDPVGRSAGRVPPGVTINQITGALTSEYGSPTQFVEIPDPRQGLYTIVLRRPDAGPIKLVIEGLADDGTGLVPIFRHERECQSGKGDKWRLDVEVFTADGKLDHVSVPEKIERLKGDEPGEVSVTQAAFDGRIAELADRFDHKYTAFKNAVHQALSGQEISLVFTEEEIAGKVMEWATGPDNPAELYNMEITLNDDQIGRGSARFKYGAIGGKLKVSVRVEIASGKPLVRLTTIDVDLGALPIAMGAFKDRINNEAEEITWNLDADLKSVEMTDEAITLVVIKR